MWRIAPTSFANSRKNNRKRTQRTRQKNEFDMPLGDNVSNHDEISQAKPQYLATYEGLQMSKEESKVQDKFGDMVIVEIWYRSDLCAYVELIVRFVTETAIMAGVETKHQLRFVQRVLAMYDSAENIPDGLVVRDEYILAPCGDGFPLEELPGEQDVLHLSILFMFLQKLLMLAPSCCKRGL